MEQIWEVEVFGYGYSDRYHFDKYIKAKKKYQSAIRSYVRKNRNSDLKYEAKGGVEVCYDRKHETNVIAYLRKIDVE